MQTIMMMMTKDLFVLLHFLLSHHPLLHPKLVEEYYRKSGLCVWFLECVCVCASVCECLFGGILNRTINLCYCIVVIVVVVMVFNPHPHTQGRINHCSTLCVYSSLKASYKQVTFIFGGVGNCNNTNKECHAHYNVEHMVVYQLVFCQLLQ